MQTEITVHHAICQSLPRPSSSHGLHAVSAYGRSTLSLNYQHPQVDSLMSMTEVRIDCWQGALS